MAYDSFRQPRRPGGISADEKKNWKRVRSGDLVGVLFRGSAGLGPVGWKGHTVDEHIDLSTLSVAAKRVAVLIYRLTR